MLSALPLDTLQAAREQVLPLLTPWELLFQEESWHRTKPEQQVLLKRTKGEDLIVSCNIGDTFVWVLLQWCHQGEIIQRCFNNAWRSDPSSKIYRKTAIITTFWISRSSVAVILNWPQNSQLLIQYLPLRSTLLDALDQELENGTLFWQFSEEDKWQLKKLLLSLHGWWCWSSSPIKLTKSAREFAIWLSAVESVLAGANLSWAMAGQAFWNHLKIWISGPEVIPATLSKGYTKDSAIILYVMATG